MTPEGYGMCSKDCGVNENLLVLSCCKQVLHRSCYEKMVLTSFKLGK